MNTYPSDDIPPYVTCMLRGNSTCKTCIQNKLSYFEFPPKPRFLKNTNQPVGRSEMQANKTINSMNTKIITYHLPTESEYESYQVRILSKEVSSTSTGLPIFEFYHRAPPHLFSRPSPV